MEKNTISSLKSMVAAFFARFTPQRLDRPEALFEFISSRAAFMAQTSLYGYMKARMGTRYAVFFEDPVFAKALKNSVGAVYLDCLSDLCCYTTALLYQALSCDDQKATRLAQACFNYGLNETSGQLPTLDSVKASKDFEIRLESLAWPTLLHPDTAFEKSIHGLIKHAPVVDAFKEQDHGIVSNSIKFHWRDVREQLHKRINIEALILHL